MSLKAAAAAFSVSPATAHRWWHRWREASEDDRQTLSCLLDRSSRPHRSPRRLTSELEQAICGCRRATGWGPRLIAGATRVRALDRLEGAEAGQHLASTEDGEGASQPLRVAVPGRSPAYGHQPLRAFPAAGPPGYRRSLTALTHVDAPGDEGWVRLRACDRR